LSIEVKIEGLASAFLVVASPEAWSTQEGAVSVVTELRWAVTNPL